MKVDIRTPYSLIATKQRRPTETLADIYAWPEVPKHRPVLCMVDGLPVLRKEDGWNVVPAATSEVAFVPLPGKNGGDVLKLVAILAVVVIANVVAGPIANSLVPFGVATATTVSLVKLGIVIAGTLLLNALLPPAVPPTPDSSVASPSYSVQAQGNAARLEASIPKLYGNMVLVPDYAAPPYYEYRNNQMYLYQLFSLGDGSYQKHIVRTGKSVFWDEVNGIAPTFADSKIAFYEPGEVVSVYPAPVVTSSEVSDQELRASSVDGKFSVTASTINLAGDNHGDFSDFSPGDVIHLSTTLNVGDFTVVSVADNFEAIGVNATLVTESGVGGRVELAATSGPYAVCAADEVVDEIALDFICPQGLFYADDDGKLQNYSLSIRVDCQVIDEIGNPLGPWIALLYQTYTNNNKDVLRITEKVSATPFRYQVRVRRLTNKETGENAQRFGNQITWVGLKGRLQHNHIYPEVSTMAVEIRASNQMTGSAARQFSVVQTAIIPVYDGNTWTDQPTRSIAWAAADIARNANYGGGIAASGLDLEKLLELDAIWTSRGDFFDAVYDGEQTIWDALSACLKAGRAQPIMVAGLITFIRDQLQALPRGMITPRRGIAGSFSTTHIFFDDKSPDDVITNYMDRRTWTMVDVRSKLPGSLSLSPARIDGFGITDRLHAWREGIYQAAVNKYRRIFASVTTGMDGRILLRNHQVLVSHDVPEWSESGDVMSRDGATLLLSEDVTWSLTQNNYIWIRRLNSKPWGPVLVTRGASDKLALIDFDSLTETELAQGPLAGVMSPDPYNQPNTFLFGAGLQSFRKMLIVTGKSKDLDTVDLTLVTDNPAVYAADTIGGPDEPDVDPVTPGTPVMTGLGAVLHSGTDPVSIDVSWAAAAGATGYVIQSSYDNMVWTPRFSGAGLSTTIAGLNAGLIYFRGAADGTAGQGPFATTNGTFGTSNPLPAPPASVTGSWSGGTLQAIWTAGARATSYLVSILIESVPGSGTFDTAVVTDFETAGLLYNLPSASVTALGGPWAAFRVSIKGKNVNGNSVTAATSTVGVVLPAITNLRLIGTYTGGDAQIAWDAVSGATTYFVAVRPNGGAVSRTTEAPVPVYTYTAAFATADGGSLAPFPQIQFDVHGVGGALSTPIASLLINVVDGIQYMVDDTGALMLDDSGTYRKSDA